MSTIDIRPQADGIPVGECWLQKMNLKNVLAMYDGSVDVRRIDMAIGEKEYWNKGIGSEFIPMVVDFAFSGERVDVLHCFCEDYNPRSRSMWEKNGFALILSEDLPQPQKREISISFQIDKRRLCEQKAGY